MRKINIIHVGGMKTSERYYHEAVEEYIKRLSQEFRIADIEIKETDLKTEGRQILEKTNHKAFKIALCVEGKKLSSEDFAELIYRRGELCPSVDFFIGSSYGLSDEVKQSADYPLSLSEMTFNHRLARVMLMEQIYRAYAIETGRKYHK